MAACVPERKEEGDEQDQTVAVCLSMWREREGKTMDKAINLEEMTRQVRDAWHSQFQTRPPVEVSSDGWVKEVFDEYVIVETPDGLFQYPYTRTEDGITFGEPAEVEMEYRPAKNNALKTIKRTDDELRVGNYIVLFEGRDLEGIKPGTTEIEWLNPDGSRGEYFSKSTDLSSPYTAMGRFALDVEHGIARQKYGSTAPGRDDVIGYVDWSTKRVDDTGVWVERALDAHNQYMQWIETLIEAGVVGTSSEAIPDAVQKAADGAILKWPLRRDTLTITPMEWRNKGDNVVQALKALGLVPDDTADEPKPEAAPEANKAAQDAARARLLRLRLSQLEEQ
jgi:hypothetical protein